MRRIESAQSKKKVAWSTGADPQVNVYKYLDLIYDVVCSETAIMGPHFRSVKSACKKDIVWQTQGGAVVRLHLGRQRKVCEDLDVEYDAQQNQYQGTECQSKHKGSNFC